jgi:hypothetical protein
MAQSDDRQTLDIPNGTTFEFKDGKLIFGHESDIVIRTNLGGYKFRKIFSKRGSVQVVPPEGVEFDVDEIEAAEGDVFLNGRVRVRHAHGRTIHFQDGHLVADRLEAREEIVLAGTDLDVVHVKAPRVQLKQDARGTCLVVESQNDPGAIRAKGGFRTVADARAAFARLEGGGASAAGRAAEAPAAASTAAATAASTAGTTLGEPMLDSDVTRPGSSTEEINLHEMEGGQSSLPKSSVFRKRR